MKRQLALVLIALALPAFASEADETGRLRGAHLDLLWKDHHLTGQVAGRTVAAEPLENEFGMRLTHRVNGREFSAVLNKTGNKIGGTVDSLDRSGKPVRTVIEIAGVDAAAGVVSGYLNRAPFKLQVSADQMSGHHFVAPRFVVQVGNKPYRFQMDGGQACMGCVVKISLVVLSMLGVGGAL
jgi:hypothetical protein